MRSINKVILIGNLTRDPEMRQTPSGQSVTTFGVATNRTWVTKNTEKKSEAEYHEVVAWGNLAEICSKYLKKGKLVYIEGYLKTRSWDTPEGIRRFKTEVVVQDMIMLDKKNGYDSEEEFIPTENDNPYIDDIDDNQQMTPSEEEEVEAPAPAAVETPTVDEEPAQPKSEDKSKLGIDDDLGL